ncbi:MAG TPA: YihY/virulence factor BrkB family protein [Candidatus Limnocylindrales bacterium]
MSSRRQQWLNYMKWLDGVLRRAPRRPSELRIRSWVQVVWRTIKRYLDGELDDRAAALTYYGIMSIFPGLVVLLSALGFFGEGFAARVEQNLQGLAPGPSRQIITEALTHLRENPRTAGIVAIASVVVAFWSATGYIGSFMRASNRIFDVPEGRPLWKTIPLQFAMTTLTGVFLVVSSLAVFFTGRLASAAGQALGVKESAVRVFDVVKWPALALAVMLMIALLYWVAPNARHGGFRWITPGSILAVVLWIAASAGFALYIAQFDSFNRTYGTLGGVIIFLVWLWLTNVAILLGAQLDAELARTRAILAGLPEDVVPYLPVRDIPDTAPPPSLAGAGAVADEQDEPQPGSSQR